MNLTRARLRRRLTLATVLALLVALSAPALAITHGTADGTAHPNVGSMVFVVPGFFEGQVCSGTLISEDVFLTAGHCVFDLDDLVAEFPTLEIKVTFDSTIDFDGGTFYDATDWAAHPEYNNFSGKGGASDPHDVGVLVLAGVPLSITPADLPTEGKLDDLKADHVLKDTRFTAVGYGSVRDTNRTGFQGILDDNLDRNRAEQGFLSLTSAWLTLPMTPSNGNGGTCYGDSGGPHFIHIDGAETDIVVSVTSTGDAPCKATDKTYRVDTASTLEFLAVYVP